MAYSTSAEIQADFKNTTFDATTNVTATDVTQFIVESDALIDHYVGQRYEIPVTGGATALSLLKLFSRSLTADRVRAILEVKQATNVDGNQNPRRNLLTYAEVLAELKKIQKSDLELIGATPLVASGPFYSSNDADSVTPVMKKDERQW